MVEIGLADDNFDDDEEEEEDEELEAVALFVS